MTSCLLHAVKVTLWEGMLHGANERTSLFDLRRHTCCMQLRPLCGKPWCMGVNWLCAYFGRRPAFTFFRMEMWGVITGNYLRPLLHQQNAGRLILVKGYCMFDF